MGPRYREGNKAASACRLGPSFPGDSIFSWCFPQTSRWSVHLSRILLNSWVDTDILSGCAETWLESVLKKADQLVNGLFKRLHSGLQTNSLEYSERVAADELEGRDIMTQLMKALLGGALSLSMAKGQPIATDTLFTLLRNFPKERRSSFVASRGVVSTHYIRPVVISSPCLTPDCPRPL